MLRAPSPSPNTGEIFRKRNSRKHSLRREKRIPRVYRDIVMVERVRKETEIRDLAIRSTLGKIPFYWTNAG